MKNIKRILKEYIIILEIERNKLSETDKDLKKKEYIKKYQTINNDKNYEKSELEINKILNNLKKRNDNNYIDINRKKKKKKF